MMPRLSLLVVLALAGIPVAAGAVFPVAGQIGVLLTVLAVAAALVDTVVSPSPAGVEVRRENGDVLSVGARNPVTLWLTNRNTGTLTVDVHDEPPLPGTLSGLPFRIDLPPGRRRYAIYHVQPHHRGRNGFGRIFLRCRSRFGLWTLCDERLQESPVRIYPDIKSVHGAELLARQNRLADAGVKLSRLRGRGNEFERLRDYHREDEYRSIDWKATARHERIISREYVVERNQNVLFLLDTGRSMCNETDGITHFDRALNAVIFLSYVALRQGDTVGILACSNSVERWIPPLRGGAGAVQTLVRHTYDLEPVYAASDYGLMVEELRRRYRKRSLVILVTHALDDVHLETIGRHMRQLRSPHLALVAFLRNVPLHERVETVPQTDLEAFQVAAAADMAEKQTAQLARLQKSGLLVLDALPAELSPALIGQYLEIKARHLL